ncbi:uncharacterized protein E0L32_010048 [Thyridium curvatum]|uniref:RING-type domain-containing protein n=1 Tax=Thyridium curvatum TaxID=1093900 RepID=A0A507AU49_9PEZI|nr:uncharacterized protein E0L32_010048 [Thyridium curvatum]TPX08431.1 hypothetical protein E0L32_010048 [Thyridium curvatum]
MVFSALLGQSADRSTRPPSSRPKPSPATSHTSVMTASSDGHGRHGSTGTITSVSTGPLEYISDEAQLRPLPPDAPDLRELNNSLEALAAVFPDVQIDVFREMLSSFEGESRLALVADALLKNRVTWVKGRWKAIDKEKRGSSLKDTPPALPVQRAHSASLIPRNEVFRSAAYKKAAKTLAWHEFKGLSKSTINAVLAEQNYSYLEARRELVALSSKSWRFTISSLFLRRKPVTVGEAENHPLIIWRSSGRGSIIPSIKSTGNEELDQELFNELISPLKTNARRKQEESDRTVALELNTEEAEKCDATYECACCFTTATFEEFTTCNVEGHMICFRCVQHSITEAVFGQGWHRSIEKETGTLRCPAVDSIECDGCVSSDQLHRAMLEEQKGAEIMHKLEQRLAEHSLLSSQLPLVRCPFCEYAEVDDIYLPPQESQLRVKADSVYSLILLFLMIAMSPFLLPVVLVSSFLALLISSKRTTFGDYVINAFSAALTRYRRRRRGSKFTCQNPSCGRVSCLSCSKEWADIHVCHESSLVALRTQVEQAMSMAIKRVCPRCNTSFVKNAGCNKLTCPCGYKMCYVCRKDIGGSDGGEDVGYRHFCEHFRPEGDPRQCRECNKCNLWESENTEAVLAAAKREAERKWKEMEQRELSGSERAFLETGVAAKKGPGGGEQGFEGAIFRGRIPTVAELCDLVIETVFV